MTGGDSQAFARVAPCGLDCGRCLAHADGPVRRAALELKAALGPNFAVYAERFAAKNPVFGDWPAFSRLLNVFAAGQCRGCREAGCPLADCGAPRCTHERGVRFCFECPEFPCANPGIPEAVAPLWRKNNETLRRIGLEAYVEGLKTRPRYP